MNYFQQKWYNDNIWHKKEPKKYLLWIDDLRGVPNSYIGEYEIIYARTYEDALKELNRFRYDVICLDHDLGGEKTGYDICKYIVENHIQCNEFRIHTSNPVGRKNMTDLLRRYTNANVVQM